MASIAVARNAKQLKLQGSSSPDSDDINESLVLPRVEPDTEEQQSESTVDEEVFNEDTAKECFEEWIRCQPKETIKMFAVTLMDTLRRRFDLTDVASAQETGLLYGYNEKTVRRWRRDFYDCKGEFSDSVQGKHSRSYVDSSYICKMG